MASESSVEAYTRALKMGCKCLECKLEIYCLFYNENDDDFEYSLKKGFYDNFCTVPIQ